MALKLESAASMIANLKRGERGSEDACFVHGNWAGVADGVGAYYIKYQVDSGVLARELMHNCQQLLLSRSSGDDDDLGCIISSAAASCTADGAATAVVAGLSSNHKNRLDVVNVGDTGCVVIRGDRVVAKTTPGRMQRIPYQVSKYESVQHAELLQVPLCCGDIVVLGSDGLWDNLELEEIVKVCRDTIQAGVQLVAKVLLRLARYSGKTPDDITIVVSIAVPETGMQELGTGSSSCSWIDACLQDEKKGDSVLWNALCA